ncbi:zinc-dependent metalloprotease family protein [Tahibacter amnicola]|uniref:M66 family metalloprotease n=1 Tax=Tahibacter amnicola TaxID=2976241 RepID=A0ABY6BEI2_9GAMM|nr:zinc-dependent metalloprotease family protein [Tahibacter amnicola]UXI66760.1 M66 family metalloprotease [Tahibacter amnicola]
MFFRSMMYVAVAAAGLTATQQAAALNLYVDNVYITQATQRYDRSVQLVADRQGLLRVFVLADQANTARPDVVVKLYYANASGQIYLGKTLTIKPNANMRGVLTAPKSTATENDYVNNYQVKLSAADIKKTVRIWAEVDPATVYTQSTYADDIWPRNSRDANNNVITSRLVAENVWNVPDFKANFVPVRVNATGRTGMSVDASTVDTFFTWLRRVLPVKDQLYYNAHAPYTTYNYPAANYNGWGAILSEMGALARAENNDKWHYYGVINPDYASGGTGMANIGGWAALGIQSTSTSWLQNDNNVNWRSGTFAHEIGHNLGLYHAPCGGAAGADQNFPYSGGRIGWPGYDLYTGKIYLPQSVDATGNYWTDLMGYCGYDWISDYQYKRALSWRDANDWPRAAGAKTEAVLTGGESVTVVSEAPTTVAAFAEKPGGAAPQKPTQRPGKVEDCLLVWGRVENGQMILEPAFEVQGVPDTDNASGSYRVVLSDMKGKTIRSIGFNANEGSEGNVELFSLLVPRSSVAGGRSGKIAQIRISDRKGSELATDYSRTATASTFSRGTAPTITRKAGEGVRLRWNAANHPMAMVRDADTGEILSFARGGDFDVATSAKRLDVQFSDGTSAVSQQVAVDSLQVQ